MATGVWDDLDAVARTWQGSDTFVPHMASEKRAKLIEGWRQAVAKTLS
jgi:glycerol kinase